MTSSSRSAQLKVWAQNQLTHLNISTNGNGASDWIPLSGDAGFRRYYRINSMPPTLVVDAPPELEKNQEFVMIAQLLNKNRVPVPKLYSVEIESGFFLIEDFGDTSLHACLNKHSVDEWYKKALNLLLRIQESSTEGVTLPIYDAHELRREMVLFQEWFIAKLLKYSLSGEEESLINRVFDQLITSAHEQPQVLVHRDYHSYNLMVNQSSELAALDFQDAIIGPITYDLVSLLKDCYIRWPTQEVAQWALDYAKLAADANVMGEVPNSVFLKWFDWIGLQRHIKVLGIFSRLSLRDNKHKYLNDLPLVVHYVRQVTSQYEDFYEFGQWFDTALMPHISKQTWWAETS